MKARDAYITLAQAAFATFRNGGTKLDAMCMLWISEGYARDMRAAGRGDVERLERRAAELRHSLEDYAAFIAAQTAPGISQASGAAVESAEWTTVAPHPRAGGRPRNPAQLDVAAGGVTTAHPPAQAGGLGPSRASRPAASLDHGDGEASTLPPAEPSLWSSLWRWLLVGGAAGLFLWSGR